MAAAGFTTETMEFVGLRPRLPLYICPPNPLWPYLYRSFANGIRSALGELILTIDHVGSTAVQGMVGKNIIDIDITVPDPTDEAAYVPALERLGYRLYIRQTPAGNSHRMLGWDTDPMHVNLHVFPPDCDEVKRHLVFRDWLRRPQNLADRELYANAKREAARLTELLGESGTEYNRRKSAVLRAILARAIAASRLDL